MSTGHTIYHSLLKLPLSVMVKSSSIPSNPIEDLKIDLERPIIYALPFRSHVDLLTLQKSALELGLPDPLSPIEIEGVKYPRYVFTSIGPKMFDTDDDLPQESLDLFKIVLKHHADNPDADFQLIPTSILWVSYCATITSTFQIGRAHV